MEKLTPYITMALAGLIAVNVWLVKQSILFGLDIQKLKSAFGFYLEKTGLDSAKILAGSLNPTPPEMQELLKRYPDELNDVEKEKLRRWLHSVMEDVSVAKGERSIALQLLAAMDTIKRLAK